MVQSVEASSRDSRFAVAEAVPSWSHPPFFEKRQI